MKITTISPIASLRGKLTKDHYVRVLANGVMVVAHNPVRKGHQKTPQEQANQERFKRDWASRNRTATV